MEKISRKARMKLAIDEARHFSSWELDIEQMNKILLSDGQKEMNSTIIEMCQLLVAISEDAYRKGLECKPFSCFVPIKRKIRTSSSDN